MAQKEKNQNDRLLKTVIALLLVFVLLMGGALCWFLIIKPNMDKGVKGGQREAEALQGSINHMTEEEIQQALNDIVEEGMFRISIASDIIAIETDIFLPFVHKDKSYSTQKLSRLISLVYEIVGFSAIDVFRILSNKRFRNRKS